MLATIVPADVHQLDRVERASAAPWGAGGVRTLALEAVLDGYEPGTAPVAPAHPEIRADVREQGDVDVLEEAVADVIRLGADEFLGDARPDADGAGNLLALHDLLEHDRGGDVHRLARVVAFAMAGRAFNHRLAVRDARCLRRLRNAVDVRSHRDDRLTVAPRRDEGRRNAGDALFDLEAVLPEHRDEVLRRLELLEAQLAVAEELIDHLLREVLELLDVG